MEGSIMSKTCKFCGSSEGITRVKKVIWVCSECRPAVYAIINSPDIIEKAWPMFQDRAILPTVRRIKIPWRTDIPEELDATRYRAEDREKNQWYLIVSQFKKMPVELFVSAEDENSSKLQMSIANLTALTRLVSLMLRHVFMGERITLEKIREQLHKSSRQKNDLPDLVYDVLGNHSFKN
jgi:hypothetical protein